MGVSHKRKNPTRSCALPPTLDTYAGHRRPVVTSLLMGLWREEKEGRKAAYTTYGSGRTRCKASHLINSQVVSSGLRQTVESLRKHLLCAEETHFSHQPLQEQ